MLTFSAIDRKLSFLLASCCKLTYEQNIQDGSFSLPDGLQYVMGFKAKAIGTLEWFGFILESDDSIIVAFRGTQSDPDWIADSLVNQREYPYTQNSGNVHSGFLSIYETCRDTIMDALAKLSSHKSLLVTGHSLGGALAVLHILDARVNTSFRTCILYNFGAPKVGDLAFRNYYNLQVANSFRFVNLFDVVPLLPPRKVKIEKIDRKWEYYHVNNLITFTSNLGSITKNHDISSYKAAIQVWN
ncbi:lipase family protein [Ectobacillus polymachus]|uniref:lipase family protein n=1 Tax=Ectobacillus polymachus TaxID=1508806 RepID=UPI003A8BC970